MHKEGPQSVCVEGTIPNIRHQLPPTSNFGWNSSTRNPNPFWYASHTARRPLSCFEDLFKPNYIQALVLSKPILVLGDLNCNTLKDCPENRALSYVSTELNLTQIIKTPTRITDNSQSLIDVILVSSPTHVHESGVLNIRISDHHPIYAFLTLKSPKTPSSHMTVCSYKNYNPPSFTADLASKSDRLLSIMLDRNTNVNTKLTTFYDVFHSTLEVHAPVKTLKVRSRPCPYVTREMKDQIKARDQLHRRFL